MLASSAAATAQPPPDADYYGQSLMAHIYATTMSEDEKKVVVSKYVLSIIHDI